MESRKILLIKLIIILFISLTCFNWYIRINDTAIVKVVTTKDLAPEDARNMINTYDPLKSYYKKIVSAKKRTRSIIPFKYNYTVVQIIDTGIYFY